MQAFSNFLHRYASWRTLGIAFVAYVIFPAVLLPNAEQAINRAAGKEVGIIDLGIGFDVAKIKQQVADYGDAGRDLYRRTELTLDILYPLAYAFFFSFILSLLMRGLPLDSGLRHWNILPFIMLAFDYVEDVFIVMMLSNYPDWSDTTAMLCAVFRLLKWVAFAGTVGLILVLVGRKFIRKVEAAA